MEENETRRALKSVFEQCFDTTTTQPTIARFLVEEALNRQPNPAGRDRSRVVYAGNRWEVGGIELDASNILPADDVEFAREAVQQMTFEELETAWHQQTTLQ